MFAHWLVVCVKSNAKSTISLTQYLSNDDDDEVYMMLLTP